MTTRRWLAAGIAVAVVAATGGVFAGRRIEATSATTDGDAIAASDAQLLWGLLQLHEAAGSGTPMPAPGGRATAEPFAHLCRQVPAWYASHVTPDGRVEVPSSRKDTP